MKIKISTIETDFPHDWILHTFDAIPKNDKAFKYLKDKRVFQVPLEDGSILEVFFHIHE